MPDFGRQLPHSDKRTTAIGFGSAYLMDGPLSGKDRGVVDAAFDAGARHFDTAPSYGLGTSEEILGQALKGRRDKVTIATKVGLPRRRAGYLARAARSVLRPLRSAFAPSIPRREANGTDRRVERNFSGECIRASLEASLRALRTDHVDLCLLHEVRLGDIGEDLLATLAAIRRSGMARAFGIATSRDECLAIAELYGAAFEVAQCRWDVLLDPTDEGDGLLPIRHRVLLGAYPALRRRFRAEPEVCARLSEACGRDLADGRTLADVLIGAAVATNLRGITLVGSRSADRTTRNIAAAQDEANLAAGLALVAALSKKSWNAADPG